VSEALIVVSDPHQRVVGAKSKTPEAANNLLKILRVLLNYAVSIDTIASNPPIGVKLSQTSVERSFGEPREKPRKESRQEPW
jgi:hypothetical protein